MNFAVWPLFSVYEPDWQVDLQVGRLGGAVGVDHGMGRGNWRGVCRGQPQAALIERGQSLVTAGDCISCHTADKNKPFAGDRPIDTPFGVIYSPNLTPDDKTGLGKWSEEDVYRALHLGIGRTGARTYPAFPYPYFTKITRDDVHAIYAYLHTLEPVNHRRRTSAFIWPLNYRGLMLGWDFLFFTPDAFHPDQSKSAEWNRGAYLVEGLGHCGACHTPKNVLGADKVSEALQGAKIQGWLAPKLAGNPMDGIGAWSIDELTEYLRTGRNKHSAVKGPMAEVVASSTSKMPEADLRAIAVYLKNAESSNTASSRPAQ
jgi:mono/diheme cytochrome c family protein